MTTPFVLQGAAAEEVSVLHCSLQKTLATFKNIDNSDEALRSSSNRCDESPT
jgi:hypothetical protein